MLKHLLNFLCIGGIVISLINCGDDDAPPCAAAPQAEAGVDQIVEGTTVVLGANDPEGSSGTWSIVAGEGGTFDEATDPGATFTGTVGETYTLAWTLAGCPASVDEVVVQFVAECAALVIPDADAGPDQSTGETQVILAANNPTPGIGTWSIVSGDGGAFENANDPETEFTGVLGETYELKWTIIGCDGSTDDVVVINILTPCQGNVPNADAGEDKLVMHATAVTLEANSVDNIVGNWTIVSGDGGSFSNLHNSNAVFTGEMGETYVLRWTLCGGNSDEITISFRGLSKITNVFPGEVIDLSIAEFDIDPNKIAYVKVTNTIAGDRVLFPIYRSNKRLRLETASIPISEDPIYTDMSIIQADNLQDPNTTSISTGYSFQAVSQAIGYRFVASPTPFQVAKGAQLTFQMAAEQNEFDVRITSLKFFPGAIEENVLCPITSVTNNANGYKIVTCTVPANLQFSGYAVLKVTQANLSLYSQLFEVVN